VEAEITQRLAAILAADVAGYSRLMQDDERATVATLDQYRAVFRDRIEANGGRVVDMAGDSVLSVFETATGAVTAALGVQAALAQANAPLPEGRRMRYRIGVNLGEVIEKADGTVYGDGVNIAARLESLAEPGGITISGSVHEQVESRLEIRADYLGEQQVKNIARPVPAWRVEAPRADGPVAGPGRAVLDRPAIAVLPFANMSGDPEQEYFADGLTEDIITALAAWRSFPVIARNSTFAYKGQAPDVRRVAEDLGARYVLEGSVRKGGNRVRITAQLIDAASGHHIWAERFDRELADIFDLQDEMTWRIASTVEPELSRAEVKRSLAKEPRHLDAWDYLQRGMSALEAFTREANERARGMFDRALAIDPAYGQAHAGIAFCHNRDLLFQFSDAREESAEGALAAARKAVELDQTDSFAHAMLAIAYMWPGRHELAIAEAEKAVELNPSNALARGVLGTALDAVGRSEDGIAEIARALQVNPQDPRNHILLNTVARAHLVAQRYEEAVNWAQKAIHQRPDYPHAQYMLASALGHLGRRDEARAALAECERQQPGFVAMRARWEPYQDPARNAHIHDGVRKAGAD
jgi:adenylate cyclase